MRYPRKITTKAQLPTAKDWKPTPPPASPPASAYQPENGGSWWDDVFAQPVRTLYDNDGRARVSIGFDPGRDDGMSITRAPVDADFAGIERRVLGFYGTTTGRSSSGLPNLAQRPRTRTIAPDYSPSAPRIGRLLQAAGFTETRDETRPALTATRLTDAMRRMREAADRAGASLSSAAAAFTIPRAISEGFQQAERERIRQEALAYNSPIQAAASDRAALFSAMYGMSDARVHYIREVDFQSVSTLREVSSLTQVGETPGTFYVDIEASWSPGAFREWFDNIEVQTDDDVCPPKFDRTVWNDPRQREAPHARFLSENASFTRRRR